MTEREFWGIVDKIRWGKRHKTLDTNVVQGEMLRKLGNERCRDLREMFYKKQSLLYKAVSVREEITGKSCDLGDDSFGDLLGHIIGLGEEEYNKVMQNPDLAIQRARASDFWESFSYCLPWPTQESPSARFSEWKDEILAEVTAYVDALPMVAVPLGKLVGAVCAPETLPETREGRNLFWEGIRQEVNNVLDTVVTTREKFQVMENLDTFLRGHSYRNYAVDVLCARAAEVSNLVDL